LRAALEGDGGGHLIEDRVKLTLIARLLRFRREHASLMREGEYIPLEMTGSRPPMDVFAFARRLGDEACIAIARTRRTEEGREEQGVVRIPLPGELAGRWRSVLTGREIELVGVRSQLTAGPGDLVAPRQPCELLLRDR
jgi:maltooligosyltrehalose synthase